MQTLTYQVSARHLLAQGFEELDNGDARQASEKGWGAAAQMIKAVASNRGWRHDTHASLYRVIDQLVEETGNSGFYRRFAVANALHFNSCENWGTTDHVAGGLRDVRDFLDRLEPLLDHRETRPLPAT